MAVGGAGGGGGGAGVRAGKAFVEFSAKDAGLSSFMASMEKKVRGFGKAMTGIGAAMVGIGGAVGGAGLIGVTNSLAEMAKIGDIAKGFDITNEAASGFFGMMEANGGVFKENIEALQQFSQKLADFSAGKTGLDTEPGRLFQGLGLDMERLTKIPITDAFMETVGAMKNLTDGTKEARFALVGGTDSSKQLQRMLSYTTDELKEQAKSFEMAGGDIDSARNASIAYQKATAGLTMAWRQVAVALAPTIQQLSEGLIPLLKDLGGWVKENKGLIVGLAGGLVAVSAAGAALMGLGMAITGITTVVATLAAVVGAVLSPAGLGIAAVGALIVVLAAAGEEVNNSRSSVTMLGEDFSTTWTSIKNAISSGNMEGAWRAMTDGLQVLWDDLTVGIVESWHLAVTEIAVEIAKLMEVFTDLKRAKDFGISVMSMGLLRSADAGGESDLVRAIREDAARAKLEREAEREKNRKAMLNTAAQNAPRQGNTPMAQAIAAAITGSLMKPIAQGAQELAKVAADARGTFSSRQDAFRQLGSEPIFDKIERNTRETADAVKKGVVVGV